MKISYTLKIAGLIRTLPILRLGENLSIASFVILGDTELVATAAPLLAKKLPQADLLVSAEAKGIPLVYELARLLGMKRYVVARKSIKPYMGAVIRDEVTSITTQKKQLLVLDENDALLVKNKRVILVDDVISTGESLNALQRLVEAAGGHVVAKAALLAEGDASLRSDIIFLEQLPVFRD